MRTPHSLSEAKQVLHEEEVKVTSSLSAIAGSRWLMAILATLTLTFGLHSIYAPARPLAIGGLSLTEFGLPPRLDFGKAGELAKSMHDAAVRQHVGAHVNAIVNQHADYIPYINYAGFALAFVLLLVNMTIMTKRRHFTRG